MKTWNTRPWSTPVTIGAGIFVAATGLTMFFITERPFKFAHELGGISFSAAILLHVLSHRRSFTNYFRQRGALGIVVTAWAIGVGLVAASSVLNMGEAEALIVDRIDSAPRAVLAPVVDMDVRQVVDRLGDEGFIVDDPEMSIRQLAQQYGADTDDLLLLVFR